MRTKDWMVLATIALGSGSLLAADVEVKADANTDNTAKTRVEADVKRDKDGKVRVDRSDYHQETRVESPVRPVNRAHNVLGMEVRNRNDEKLGEVKDLVVDLRTGKISYAALSIGGFLGLGEKLIAVPTSALTPSDHQNVLIMDATRGELVDAPGFAATNWPDPRDVNFNQSPFWRPKNSGGAAQVETGRGKIYTDADRKRETRVEANTDRTEVNLNSNRDGIAAHSTIGTIKSVSGHDVIVETSDGRTASYVVGDKATRTDFKVGDRVTVKYHRDNGKMMIDDLNRQ